jgi:D-alanyl-D-alanine carboxypeptidase
MVADYTYTDKHKQVLGSQTKEERAADRAAFDKNAKKKLSALTKKEKKGTITDAEKTELAELRALSGRVAAAQSALKHKDLEEVLAAAGTDVAAWYGALQTGKFLNRSVHVHPALAARLARAESALLADPTVNPTKLDAAGLGKKLVYSVADMRIPKSATGGTSLSMHVFGLAVDLNYKGNPFVGNASKGVFGVAMRATSLVDGAAVDIRPKLGKAGAAYDILSAVSRAMSTYFSFTGADDTTLAELVRNHTPLKGEPTDLAGWVKQIEKDRRSVAGGDFANHTAAAEGFMDLDKSLVLAMADAGLTWGGTYGGGKDIMHFDLREGEGAAIDRARNAHKAST